LTSCEVYASTGRTVAVAPAWKRLRRTHPDREQSTNGGVYLCQWWLDSGREKIGTALPVSDVLEAVGAQADGGSAPERASVHPDAAADTYVFATA